MIKTNGNSVTIEFRKGPAERDAQSCVKLSMEVLNMSKMFSSALGKGKTPGKKMEKTGRIRDGIQKFVNKTDVTPKIVDELICSIRKGQVKEVVAKLGDKEIMLYPNNDVPGVIAKLMLEKVI